MKKKKVQEERKRVVSKRQEKTKGLWHALVLADIPLLFASVLLVEGVDGSLGLRDRLLTLRL